MPDPRNVLNEEPDPVLYRGTLIDTAASETDLVRAVIPVIAEDFTTDPMDFDPRPDGQLPTAGGACLVAIDTQGFEWLLRYRPPEEA